MHANLHVSKYITKQAFVSILLQKGEFGKRRNLREARACKHVVSLVNGCCCVASCLQPVVINCREKVEAARGGSPRANIYSALLLYERKPPESNSSKKEKKTKEQKLH